ncbi:unnamed protein product [Victoria cruziana]
MSLTRTPLHGLLRLNFKTHMARRPSTANSNVLPRFHSPTVSLISMPGTRTRLQRFNSSVYTLSTSGARECAGCHRAFSDELY